ncbi:MAG TPA: glycosyltransferase family 2 protein [Caulobacteraceae bacterium]
MSDDIRLEVSKSQPIPDGVVVFTIIRDERYLLPFFFEHYRALGVVQFVVYDDRSGRDTVDFLMAQADCVVVRSDHGFGDSFGTDSVGVQRRLPMVLKEVVPDNLFPGRWVLTVDADEFLILPPPFVDLAAFVSFLDRIGQPYATAPMVDFYGESLDARNYSHSLGPFAGNPYFDAGPYYYWTGYLAPVPFMGGIRHRMLKMLCQRRPDLLKSIYGDLIPGPAKSWKVPLLKHGCGVRRLGDHEISVAPATSGATALAHFKFCPDLDGKIERALSERQYYNASAEYAFLKTAIEELGSDSLVGAETRRFEGAASLGTAGLLETASA